VQVLGEKAAYRGGYNVYTSLDWNMQQLAEKEVRQHVDALKGNNVNNAALITMDPTTGEILAYVGSYDYYMHTPQVQATTTTLALPSASRDPRSSSLPT